MRYLSGPCLSGSSQLVANEMMMKYQPDPAFVSVYLDAPDAVRVVLKNASDDQFKIGDVSVAVVGAKYSLKELSAFAEKLVAANGGLLEVEIEADKQRLRLAVPRSVVDLRIELAKPGLPSDVAIDVVRGDPEVLEAAEGGALVTGSGCTSGFMMNGNRISTASHCGDSWGTINGVAMTHRSSRCVIDNQWASGSSMGLVIRGQPLAARLLPSVDAQPEVRLPPVVHARSVAYRVRA